MKKLFLVFLIGLGMTANGWAQNENYPPRQDENYAPNRIVPGPKGDPLEIEVWADRDNEASYQEGENISLYFRANRDAYVALYDIDTRGNVFLLYPQDPRDPHFVRGGVTYRLPDRGDDYDFWVTGPPGAEFVGAVASLHSFDLPDDWPSFYRGSRAPGRSYSSPEKVDREDIEEFIYDLNSRLVPIKRYPDDCAEDLYTFYVEPRPQTVYRPVAYDYGWCDFDFPYGSEIWIDGAYCGIAPLYDYHFFVGAHIVQVYQPGCPPYVRQVYVYPRRRYSLSFSVNFNFGYRNFRYYQYYYPYTYFCFISPDYRYKYRYAYYGESRYRDVFRKDVRFKSWVAQDAGDRDWGKAKLLGDAVRRKEVRAGDRIIDQRRESKKYSPLNDAIERSRGSDRERIRTRDEEKSKPVYESYENSRKGRDGSVQERKDNGRDKQDGVRYRGWEEGKKGRSSGSYEGKKERSSGNSDQPPQVERDKRESGRSSGSYEGKKEHSGGNADQPRQVEQGKRESGRSSEPAKVERSRQEGRGSEGRGRGSSKKGRDD